MKFLIFIPSKSLIKKMSLGNITINGTRVLKRSITLQLAVHREINHIKIEPK